MPPPSSSSPSGTAAWSVAPLGQRVREAAVSLQFLWACGHFVTVLSTIFYFMTYFDAKSAAGHYTRAFIGAFVSYAVVVFKTFGVPQPNRAFAERFVTNENVQYLLLTVIWIVTPVYSVALVPFFVFSLFHLLTYTRAHLMPVFFPDLRSSATASGLPYKISKMIHSFVVQNNPMALYCVAYFEIVAVMGSLILGALTLRAVFAPLFYAQFLRLRYHLSPQSRRAFADLRLRLDALLLGTPAAPSKVPPIVGKVYAVVRNAILGYSANALKAEPAAAGATK